MVVEKYGAECIEISLSVLYKTSYIGRCRRLHRIVVQRVCRVGRLDLLVTRRVALYIATSKGAIGFASYPDQNR